MEMKPVLSVRAKDYDALSETLEAIESRLVVPEETKFFEDQFLGSLKTAQMFDAWMSEKHEDYLMETFGVSPGELQAKKNNADWLLYGLQELAILSENSEYHKPLQMLRARLKHGIKEELLNLVRINGVGRVRARKLYGLGARSITDIVKIPYPQLKNVLGQALARKLKQKVGQEQEITAFEQQQADLKRFN